MERSLCKCAVRIGNLFFCHFQRWSSIHIREIRNIIHESLQYIFSRHLLWARHRATLCICGELEDVSPAPVLLSGWGGFAASSWEQGAGRDGHIQNSLLLLREFFLEGSQRLGGGKVNMNAWAVSSWRNLVIWVPVGQVTRILWWPFLGCALQCGWLFLSDWACH